VEERNFLQRFTMGTAVVESRVDKMTKMKETDLEDKIERKEEESSLKSTVLGAAIKTIFIVGTAAIILISLRNSLTWHLSRFWGGVGDVWQLLWDKFLDTVGEDYFSLYVYGSCAVMNTVFWTVGLVYTYFDLTLWPSNLREYKIQPGTNEPIERAKFWKLIRCVLFNQTVVTLCFSYVAFFAYERRGMPDIRDLPEFHWVVLELAIYMLVEELFFYYGHKMLHHRRIYKYIHKKHHEWTASISLTSVYCHPVEHVVSNLLPAALGPILCGSHIATAWLWFTFAILTTLNSHSGYHLPFLPSPEAHDFHHLKFNQCFGVMGILDYLHGTDVLFRSSQAYQRHIILVGTTPLRETFPDPEDEKKAMKEKEL